MKKKISFVRMFQHNNIETLNNLLHSNMFPPNHILSINKDILLDMIVEKSSSSDKVKLITENLLRFHDELTTTREQLLYRLFESINEEILDKLLEQISDEVKIDLIIDNIACITDDFKVIRYLILDKLLPTFNEYDFLAYLRKQNLSELTLEESILDINLNLLVIRPEYAFNNKSYLDIVNICIDNNGINILQNSVFQTYLLNSDIELEEKNYIIDAIKHYNDNLTTPSDNLSDFLKKLQGISLDDSFISYASEVSKLSTDDEIVLPLGLFSDEALGLQYFEEKSDSEMEFFSSFYLDAIDTRNLMEFIPFVLHCIEHENTLRLKIPEEYDLSGLSLSFPDNCKDHKKSKQNQFVNLFSFLKLYPIKDFKNHFIDACKQFPLGLSVFEKDLFLVYMSHILKTQSISNFTDKLIDELKGIFTEIMDNTFSLDQNTLLIFLGNLDIPFSNKLSLFKRLIGHHLKGKDSQKSDYIRYELCPSSKDGVFRRRSYSEIIEAIIINPILFQEHYSVSRQNFIDSLLKQGNDVTPIVKDAVEHNHWDIFGKFMFSDFSSYKTLDKILVKDMFKLALKSVNFLTIFHRHPIMLPTLLELGDNGDIQVFIVNVLNDKVSSDCFSHFIQNIVDKVGLKDFIEDIYQPITEIDGLLANTRENIVRSCSIYKDQYKSELLKRPTDWNHCYSMDVKPRLPNTSAKEPEDEESSWV